MQLPIVYDQNYVTELPDNHRFPMSKFERLHTTIQHQFETDQLSFHSPIDNPLNWIKQVHESSYVDAFLKGTLSEDQIREIGLPWSEGLVERTITAVGGTARTIELALEHDMACNTAGGTHHAFADHGSGFCIFNDLAVGAYRATKQLNLSKILILDLDVHQGNGTADFFTENSSVVTASFHCESNFPFNETSGDWDIGMDSGLENAEYLSVIKNKFTKILKAVKPQLVIYDAGVDVHVGDRLGNLRLTNRGIKNRDQFVLERLAKKNIPVACVIGGGYDDDIRTLAKRHSILHQTALTVYRNI